MTNKKTCDEKQLILYHYNELDPDDRQQIEKHLEHCVDCRAALEQIKTSLAAVPTVRLELDVAEKQRFSAQVVTKMVARRRWAKPVWGSALAASGALVLAFILMPGVQKQPKNISTPALAELEMLEQLDLLQDFDVLQDFELLETLEDLG